MFILIPFVYGTKKARLFSYLQAVSIAVSTLFVVAAIHSQFSIDRFMSFEGDNLIKMLLDKQLLYCRVAMVIGVIGFGVSMAGWLFCVYTSLKANRVKTPEEPLFQMIPSLSLAVFVVPIILIMHYALFVNIQSTERRCLETINQIESNNVSSITVAITSKIRKNTTLDAFGYSFETPALTQVETIDLSKNGRYYFLFSDDIFGEISSDRTVDMDKYTGENYQKLFEEFDKLYEIFYVEYDSNYGQQKLVLEIKEVDKQ